MVYRHIVGPLLGERDVRTPFFELLESAKKSTFRAGFTPQQSRLRGIFQLANRDINEATKHLVYLLTPYGAPHPDPVGGLRGEPREPNSLHDLEHRTRNMDILYAASENTLSLLVGCFPKTHDPNGEYDLKGWVKLQSRLTQAINQQRQDELRNYLQSRPELMTVHLSSCNKFAAAGASANPFHHHNRMSHHQFRIMFATRSFLHPFPAMNGNVFFHCTAPVKDTQCGQEASTNCFHAHHCGSAVTRPSLNSAHRILSDRLKSIINGNDLRSVFSTHLNGKRKEPSMHEYFPRQRNSPEPGTISRADGIALLKSSPVVAKGYLWDATIVAPLPSAECTSTITNKSGEHSCAMAEKQKMEHYSSRFVLSEKPGLHFTPVAFDIYGAAGPQTAKFVNTLASYAYPPIRTTNNEGQEVTVVNPLRARYIHQLRTSLAVAAMTRLAESTRLWVVHGTPNYVIHHTIKHSLLKPECQIE